MHWVIVRCQATKDVHKMRVWVFLGNSLVDKRNDLVCSIFSWDQKFMLNGQYISWFHWYLLNYYNSRWKLNENEGKTNQNSQNKNRNWWQYWCLYERCMWPAIWKGVGKIYIIEIWANQWKMKKVIRKQVMFWWYI